MDNDNDFTFCKVASSADGDDAKAKTLASEIGGITIEDDKSTRMSDDKGSSVVWKDGVSSKEEKTAGTLSFTVVDKSTPQQSSDLSPQVASGNGDTSAKSTQRRTPARKPAVRAKVPFEIGHSQMDWLNLTRTHPDLAGLNGQSNKRLISIDEVKQHRAEGSMWTVLKGRVYNLSPYMKFHPGGVDMLMKAVGKDCTSLFNKYHAWVNAEFLMEKCLVGILDDTSKYAPEDAKCCDRELD
ncbi:unnamed protein product [Linum tenue]|uniref:Cytochrome b5 heme-binding domain-containing protein n=1 Tax=Linum tenue TaxID=586396 RepID=A0AAV0JJD4_9ROSI|nr:unnamed protein product [Linum tenue]